MTDLITCHKCGAVIGQVVVIAEGIEPLDDGAPWLITTASGTCKRCGAEIHFNAAGHRFNKAIKAWREETKPVI